MMLSSVEPGTLEYIDHVSKLKMSKIRLDRLKSNGRIQEEGIETARKYLYFFCRLKAESNVLAKENVCYLQCIEERWTAMKGVVPFIEDRLSSVPLSKDKNQYTLWLEEEKKKIIPKIIQCDNAQGELLHIDTQRIKMEIESIVWTGELLSSIFHSFYSTISWESERVASELAYAASIKFSEESLSHAARINEINQKVRLTIETTLTIAKEEIQKAYEKIEQQIDETVSFKIVENIDDLSFSDINPMTTQAFLRITGKKIEKFVEKKWMDEYHKQPWLQKSIHTAHQGGCRSEGKQVKIYKSDLVNTIASLVGEALDVINSSLATT